MIPTYKDHRIPVVYLITCKVNGKIYVGSAVDFYHRHKRYRQASDPELIDGVLIHRAMRKYGFDQFEFSILENVTNKDDLIEREQYWIDTLTPFRDTGYNLNPTAGSWLGAKHSEETKMKLREKAKAREQTPGQKEGLKKAIEAARLTNTGRMNVSVVRICPKTMSVCQHYNSLEQAAEAVNVDDSNISRACKNKGLSKGFYWAKQSEIEDFVPKPKRRRSGKTFYRDVKPVIQMSMDGQIIRSWRSYREIEKQLGYLKANISRCCNQKANSAYGFTWKFVADLAEIERLKNELKIEYDAFRSQELSRA